MKRVLAEYADDRALVRAARLMHERGYRELDAYSPFAVSELDELVARGPSRLPWLVFAAGMAGAAAAYGLEWLLNGYLYPLNVGGRPPHFPLAYVPIAFEMGILCAGLCAFIAALALSGLPALFHPVFEVEGFASASNDGFWLEISAADPRYRAGTTERELGETGAARVVSVGDVS